MDVCTLYVRTMAMPRHQQILYIRCILRISLLICIRKHCWTCNTLLILERRLLNLMHTAHGTQWLMMMIVRYFLPFLPKPASTPTSLYNPAYKEDLQFLLRKCLGHRIHSTHTYKYKVITSLKNQQKVDISSVCHTRKHRLCSIRAAHQYKNDDGIFWYDISCVCARKLYRIIVITRYGCGNDDGKITKLVPTSSKRW